MADRDVEQHPPPDEPLDVDALVAALSREALARRRWGMTLRAMYLAAIGVPITVWLVRCAISGAWSHPWPAWINLLNVVTWVSAAATAAMNKRSAAGRLASCEDARAIGPLAQVASPASGFFDYDERVRKQAASALVPLLREVRPSDAPLLTDPQRDALLRLLRGKDEVLVVAILRALEQIGDERFVPVVEQLAGGKRVGREDQVTRDAARACLPTLRERVRQQEAAALLLRPADAPADTLLRPASGAAPEDDTLLLRASEGEARNS